MKTTDYLDRARALTDTGSDYALARLLGISENAVNQYRQGKRVIDDYTALLLAELLDVPLTTIIATAALEREKNDAKRAKWKHYLKTHGRAAALVLCALQIAAPHGAEATTATTSATPCRGLTDAVSIIRTSVARLFRLLEPLTPHWPGQDPAAELTRS